MYHITLVLWFAFAYVLLLLLGNILFIRSLSLSLARPPLLLSFFFSKAYILSLHLSSYYIQLPSLALQYFCVVRAFWKSGVCGERVAGTAKNKRGKGDMSMAVVQKEPERVMKLRGGSVLGKKTILKSDHFPGCQNKRLTPQIDGAPNYRQVLFLYFLLNTTFFLF